jgi:uncharacterized protein (TIGR02391 family)
MKAIRMVRQSRTQTTKQSARLTPQEMRSGIKRLNKCLESVRNFDPQSVTDQHRTPELNALEASIDEALALTFGADTLEYDRYKSAKDFDRGPYNSAYKVPPHEFQKSIARSKESSIALLRQVIKSIEERLEENSTHPPQQLRKNALNQTIREKVWQLFSNEQYDTAVFEAMKAVEVSVRDAAGLSAKEIGKDLMRKAFDVNAGPLTDMQAEPAERQARSDLFAGAMGSYKEPALASKCSPRRSGRSRRDHHAGKSPVANCRCTGSGEIGIMNQLVAFVDHVPADAVRLWRVDRGELPF